MSRAMIGRWGKTLAVRFPINVAKAAGLHDGQQVEIVAAEGGVIIRDAEQGLTAETMFRGQSPEFWREVYSNTYDWGPERGRERLDE